MNIAILGGRFDPPHVGHFLVAQQILEAGPSIDKVFFVPAFAHQWKPIIASPQERIAMLTSSLEPDMEISDVEIKREGISYSIDTIREIKKNTQANIFWIVGSDILPEFHKWKKADELTREAKFLVFPRDLHPLPSKLPEGFTLLQSPELITTDFSSTVIRSRIRKKLSIKYMVPKEIEAYIKEHNLYE